MSNKSKISSVLGVVAATVLAAGGSAFVTETGLQMYEKQNAIRHESEQLAVIQRETELPITVENFTASKDSFTVKPVSEKDNKKESEQKDTEKAKPSTQVETEKADSSVLAEGGETEEKAEAVTETESESTAAGAEHNIVKVPVKTTTESEEPNIVIEGNKGNKPEETEKTTSGSTSSLPAGAQPVEMDEWGGWMAVNGNYYDGQGGYYDEAGYHYVGDSIKTPDRAVENSPSYGSGSSGSSGYSESYDDSYNYAWDDSYILYDTAVRYLSKGELSDWGPWELAAARNEIFARHGRIFYTAEWSSYFAQKSWYTPRYDNVDDLLSDCEWANLNLIMKLEEKFY